MEDIQYIRFCRLFETKCLGICVPLFDVND
jgi:hypothetical protein